MCGNISQPLARRNENQNTRGLEVSLPTQGHVRCHTQPQVKSFESVVGQSAPAQMFFRECAKSSDLSSQNLRQSTQQKKDLPNAQKTPTLNKRYAYKLYPSGAADFNQFELPMTR